MSDDREWVAHCTCGWVRRRWTEVGGWVLALLHVYGKQHAPDDEVAVERVAG